MEQLRTLQSQAVIKEEEIQRLKVDLSSEKFQKSVNLNATSKSNAFLCRLTFSGRQGAS